ncbi:MAG: hypothetical protein OXH13_04435 [Chloroflexi bacterium]|nr:hypothetical protein [Chloroflexota bacterium]MCY3572289.1 hypothetical protein [Chloroflexota bacterium]MCY3684578.1 hypothetical protein [Chloroflexota bacterium]MCY3696060.1 hypothetical protein [Chloroflexota bacterium]
MTTPDIGFEQVELATGNDIAVFFDRANDEAVVFAFLSEEDDAIGAAITLAYTTVERALALIQAFRNLEANG